jgi:ribosomal protein L13
VGERLEFGPLEPKGLEVLCRRGRARLSLASGRPRQAVRTTAPLNALEHRIRRLLAPSRSMRRGFTRLRVLTGAPLLPRLAMPLSASVHRLIEEPVDFAR